MANNERLDEILEFIKANEDQWNQEAYGVIINQSDLEEKLDLQGYELSDYRYIDEVKEVVDQNKEICKSAYCFAGHAVIAYTPFRPTIAELLEGWHYVDAAGQSRSGWNHTVHSLAQEVLGLTADQAEALFDGFNELETLEALIEAIKADPTVDMDTLYAIQAKLQPDEYEDYEKDE